MAKTFIIAEAGINHNGSLEIAVKLIKAAKAAGCDAIKFQKRSIDRVYSKEELDKPRESPWGTTNRQQKAGLEFGKEAYDIIDGVCKAEGIEWFATPWDLESVEFLAQYNCKYAKVPSPLLTHVDLLTSIAKQGRYTFISTGMSTMEEIERAVKIFKASKCPFELMHCNSQYPMPDERANLKCIRYLRHNFGVDCGYSGHEVGLITSVAAVCLGATSIERHITLDRSMYGSDQSSSVEPDGFKRLVDYIRIAEVAIAGPGDKAIWPEELESKKKLRRTKDY